MQFLTILFMLISVCYWEENISKHIEIPYLLTVLLSIPLNKLPCTTPRLFEVSPCWNCSTLHDTSHSMHCHQCNVLCAPPSQSNFFDLMQQPKNFEIDLKNLAKIFKQLQSQLHPDRYSTREEQELKVSKFREEILKSQFSTKTNNFFTTFLPEPLKSFHIKKIKAHYYVK